jgi:hypothetical protein
MKKLLFLLTVLLFLNTNNAFSFCMRDPFTGNLICPPEPPTPTPSIDKSLSPQVTSPSPTTPRSSSGVGGGFSPSEQMQMMMIQGILQPLFNSLFNPTIPSRSQGPTPEEQRRMEEEKLRKEAQERLELFSKWQSLRKQSTTSVNNRNKNLSSLLVVDVNPIPEESSKNLPQGTPFFNDVAGVFGNLIMDESIEKIEDIGKDVIDKLGEKYKKEWGTKLYEKGLPILKIAVAGTVEGKEAAGVETINYAVSLLSKPMSSLQAGVADIGRKIYAKISFGAIDNFLGETEKAGNYLGFNFSKDKFMEDFENSLTQSQRIIYKWLKE